jgi:hypothetical protein
MVKYEHVLDLMRNVPKFRQPIYMKTLRLYLHIEDGFFEKNEQMWGKVTDDLPLSYKVIYLDWIDLKNNIIRYTYKELSNDDKFRVVNKVIYDNNEHYDVPDDLIQCNNCGNVWDGFAQCLCYDSDYE